MWVPCETIKRVGWGGGGGEEGEVNQWRIATRIPSRRSSNTYKPLMLKATAHKPSPSRPRLRFAYLHVKQRIRKKFTRVLKPKKP